MNPPVYEHMIKLDRSIQNIVRHKEYFRFSLDSNNSMAANADGSSIKHASSNYYASGDFSLSLSLFFYKVSGITKLRP
jgi:hypothetical protein